MVAEHYNFEAPSPRAARPAMLSVPYPFPHRPNKKAPPKRPLISLLDVTLFKSDKKRAPDLVDQPPPPPAAEEPAAPPPSAHPVVGASRESVERELAPPPPPPPPPPAAAAPGGEDSFSVFLKLTVDALVEEKNEPAAVEAFCTVFSVLHKREHAVAPRVHDEHDLVLYAGDDGPLPPAFEMVELPDGELVSLVEAIKRGAVERPPPVHPPASERLASFFREGLLPGSPLLAALSDRLGAHAYDVVSDRLWKSPPVRDAADFAARYTPDWRHVPMLPPYDSPCGYGEGHARVRHGSNSNACASFRARVEPECACPRDRCISCFFETALRDLVARIADRPSSAWDCVLACRNCGGLYCPFSVFSLFEPEPRAPLSPPIIDVKPEQPDEVLASGGDLCACYNEPRHYAPPSLAALGAGKCFFDMMLEPKGERKLGKRSHTKDCPLHSSHKSGKKTGGKPGRPPKIKKEAGV